MRTGQRKVTVRYLESYRHQWPARRWIGASPRSGTNHRPSQPAGLSVPGGFHIAFDDMEDQVIGKEVEPDAHHRERGVESVCGSTFTASFFSSDAFPTRCATSFWFSLQTYSIISVSATSSARTGTVQGRA